MAEEKSQQFVLGIFSRQFFLKKGMQDIFDEK